MINIHMTIMIKANAAEAAVSWIQVMCKLDSIGGQQAISLPAKQRSPTPRGLSHLYVPSISLSGTQISSTEHRHSEVIWFSHCLPTKPNRQAQCGWWVCAGATNVTISVTIVCTWSASQVMRWLHTPWPGVQLQGGTLFDMTKPAFWRALCMVFKSVP